MATSISWKPLYLKCAIKKKHSIAIPKKSETRRIQKLKKGVEVTRFKGLGEISPNEFKQFIGKDIRLSPSTSHTFSDIKPTLEFYMGKNTPERKQFIMENLINEDQALELEVIAQLE